MRKAKVQNQSVGAKRTTGKKQQIGDFGGSF
jgi:hypothetical protein